MRKRFALLVTAAAVATAAPAGAAPAHVTKPQLHDAAADWKVASQDVLDATWTATAKQLRADLHLSAPPAATAPALYDVVFVAGCTPYSLHLTWTGDLSRSQATLDEYPCDSGDAVMDAINGSRPVASTPATATITTTGLRIVAAPTVKLHRGVRGFPLAEVRLAPVIVGSSFSWNDPSYGGDIGVGDHEFRLGS